VGSAPASGAVGRAVAVHSVHTHVHFLVRAIAWCSARGLAELQPRRLRSPCIPTAYLQERENISSGQAMVVTGRARTAVAIDTGDDTKIR
jgi:hypothetical protein